MMAPHASSIASHKDDNGKSIYLVSGVSAGATGEDVKIKLLEEKVHQLNYELARLTSRLFHKDQLLQNFHVREQELKAALFHSAM